MSSTAHSAKRSRTWPSGCRQLYTSGKHATKRSTGTSPTRSGLVVSDQRSLVIYPPQSNANDTWYLAARQRTPIWIFQDKALPFRKVRPALRRAVYCDAYLRHAAVTSIWWLLVLHPPLGTFLLSAHWPLRYANSSHKVASLLYSVSTSPGLTLTIRTYRMPSQQSWRSEGHRQHQSADNQDDRLVSILLSPLSSLVIGYACIAHS